MYIIYTVVHCKPIPCNENRVFPVLALYGIAVHLNKNNSQSNANFV